MISIITCSTNPDFFYLLEKSIKDTCIFDFEIIKIDNTIEQLSLTQAYNKGAKKSQFPNLVFVHEDVEFMNSCWDESLLTLLENKEIGIIGIAGSTYLPSAPSGWYLPDEKYNKVFIRQGFKYKEAPIRFDNQGEDLTPVFLLDGVFLAMRKEVWMEFPFNERLRGFHAYDVDICQRVCSKYQNLFTNQIELLHKSEGKVDVSYFEALITYKKEFFKFNYQNIDYKIEFQTLINLYKSLSLYYEENRCLEIIKPYIKFKNLGLIRYFTIKSKLKKKY